MTITSIYLESLIKQNDLKALQMALKHLLEESLKTNNPNDQESPPVSPMARIIRKRDLCSIAASSGSIEILEWLVEVGGQGLFQPQSEWYEDGMHWTPLAQACDKGHLSVVAFLLKVLPDEFYANYTDPDNRCSYHLHHPMDIAATAGHLSILKALLGSYKFSFEGVFGSPESLLRLAIKGGHLSMVDYLIETTKVQIDQVGNRFEPTFLELAVQQGHLEIVKTMLAVTLTYGPSSYAPILKRFVLAIAAQYGHLDIAKFIFGELISDSEATMCEYDDFFHEPQEEQKIEDCGPELIIKTDKYKQDLATMALKMAAIKGCLFMMEWAMTMGADPFLKRGQAHPLITASENGLRSVIQWYLDNCPEGAKQHPELYLEALAASPIELQVKQLVYYELRRNNIVPHQDPWSRDRHARFDQEQSEAIVKYANAHTMGLLLILECTGTMPTSLAHLIGAYLCCDFGDDFWLYFNLHQIININEYLDALNAIAALGTEYRTGLPENPLTAVPARAPIDSEVLGIKAIIQHANRNALDAFLAKNEATRRPPQLEIKKAIEGGQAFFLKEERQGVAMVPSSRCVYPLI